MTSSTYIKQKWERETIGCITEEGLDKIFQIAMEDI